MGLEGTDLHIALATWNVENGRQLNTHRIPVGVPVTVVGGLSPDRSRFLLVQADSLHIHDVETGERLRTVVIPETALISPRAWVDDGETLIFQRFVEEGKDPKGVGARMTNLLKRPLEAWGIKDVERRWTGPSFLLTEGEVSSPSGRLLAGPFVSDTLTLWNLPDQRELANVNYPGGAMPRIVAFSPDERLLAVTTSAGQLYVYAIEVD
jgi:WD40 repeat protein